MQKANKNPKYQIKESEVGFYHLELTRKTYNEKLKVINTDKQVQIFDKKGYEQFKKFKPADIDGVEIIHDPNYKPVDKGNSTKNKKK